MKRFLACIAAILTISTQMSIAQWTQTAGPEGGTVNVLLLQGAALFAGTGDNATNGDGIYRSTDGGAHWGAANNGIAVNTTVVSMQSFNGGLLAGTTHGIYRTTDSGAHWSTLGPGILALERVSSDGGWGRLRLGGRGLGQRGGHSLP